MCRSEILHENLYEPNGCAIYLLTVGRTLTTMTEARMTSQKFPREFTENVRIFMKCPPGDIRFLFYMSLSRK